MVTGYFDDSGTSAHDSVVVVAGYIGSLSQGEKFAREWRSHLSKFNVTVMHRTDLECFHGEFAGWTPEQRTEFVSKAQQIIKRRTYVAIGNAVIKADFERMFPDRLKRFCGGAYGFCAILCLARAKRWFDKAKQQDPIEWIFEAGTDGSGHIAHLFNALYANVQSRTDFRLSRWSFAGKDEPQLQAADLIAYEVFKHATNRAMAWLSLQHLVRPQDDDFLEFWLEEDLDTYLKAPAAQSLLKDFADHNF